jgi:nucleotide-binding universal stress UspA family protein
MDKDSLESTKETIHELSEEAVDVEWEIEELVTDKCDRKIEEIEPKIAEMNFKPFHSVTCGETISTLQTLADQNDMGLIVLAGYGAVKLMEPEIAKLALESNRPILIIPSRSMREDSDMTNEETLQKRMDLTEPTGKKKLTKQKRSQGK